MAVPWNGDFFWAQTTRLGTLSVPKYGLLAEPIKREECQSVLWYRIRLSVRESLYLSTVSAR